MVTRALTVLALCLWCGALLAGCGALDTSPAPAVSPLPPLPGQSTGVFTTAHASLGGAVNDFFARRPDPVQPLEFPHNTHISQGLKCTEYCHESVTKGPVAGLPSVKTCMICHDAIAVDRPRIKQITAMRARGVDLSWQRVYGYPATSHVKFNHAPHIRANVECATCHGNIGEQTVAQRNVDLSMGYCVTCHTARKVSIDCLTCHF